MNAKESPDWFILMHISVIIHVHKRTCLEKDIVSSSIRLHSDAISHYTYSVCLSVCLSLEYFSVGG